MGTFHRSNFYDSSIEIHVLALTKDYSGPTQRQHQQRRCGGLLSVALDKPARRARVTFKAPTAAEAFRKKFNNKMVAASKLNVVLN
ncbi:hypothetical protein EVAR_92015_1 [Eumeta japonica]|uniref:Uncharacterized protein n=1 Tax=Eumeta variegata TaxID=151549 RepID=A0A4C1ZBP9_EUMVA|nr:hypothetical protein EVAR_92015_1 [Eumeta japonica]